jgi:SAM-dependent methyltransferase
MSLAAELKAAATLARWDDPPRILIDRFVKRAAAEMPPRSRVLDAGAGECMYAPAFAHCRYVACDRAIGDAAWDYGSLDVVADVAWLPFGRAVFDAVLCTQTLEHVGEPAAVLRAAAAVLKPGGKLYLSVPFLGDPIHQEPYDFFRYTPYGLRHLIEAAGLTPLSVSPVGGALFLICCDLWWCAIVYRSRSRRAASDTATLRRAAHRLLGAAMLLLARFCTMLIMTLRQTNTASGHFTYGYTVVAEKRQCPQAESPVPEQEVVPARRRRGTAKGSRCESALLELSRIAVFVPRRAGIDSAMHSPEARPIVRSASGFTW